MNNEKILLIDDSPEILNNLSEFLKDEGFDIDKAANGETGISMIERKFYDVVLTDLMMHDTDGMAVLKYVAQSSPDSICMILTGYGTIKNAVEAVKMGAYDYLTKPVKLDEIFLTLKRALEFRNLKREN
ncbi:MAG: response regulator, partial [Deltaproteobacteria bacterium]|nr:response regulator [Deltaproteobacteria bacterium]